MCQCCSLVSGNSLSEMQKKSGQHCWHATRFFLNMSGPHTVGLRLGATLKFTLLCHAFAIVTHLQRKLWREVISAKYFRQWWNSVIPHFYISRTTFILCIITQHNFDEKEDQTWLYISKIINSCSLRYPKNAYREHQEL